MDSLGGSTSYNTGAQDTPKRIEDVPPANVDPAQEWNYTLDTNVASNSEFNWDAVNKSDPRSANSNPLTDVKNGIH